VITEPALLLASIGDLPPVYWAAPIGALAALVMALVFSKSVMSKPEGDDEMIRIAQAVRDGAMAYLTQQYKIVAGVFVALLAVLLILAFGPKLIEWQSIIGVPIAGLFSGLCGWFGMKMATNASARTTHAAKNSLNEGLTVAFRSGAVMGLVVVGFALLDASLWFLVMNTFGESLGMYGGIPEFTAVMLSFGMGASTQALFARVGGGIYTKAADVGADLVGKVEAGIPEDDPRNPATIADNVGDNVGDVAGMGADLYESYYGSILATMALGAAAAMSLAGGGAELAMKLAAAPLALAGMGIFCSIIGIFTVKAKEGASFAQLLKGLHKGVYIASFLIAVVSFGLLYLLFNDAEGLTVPWWSMGLSILTGLVAGNVIAYATEYYTSYEHAPTKRIAEQALTGPATVIIAGIAEGMKSTWAALGTVVVAIMGAYIFAGGADSFLMGLYGVGIAAVGMLSTLGITLATDAYGPIADNAGGNAEMTGQPPHVRERTDMLDSLGNTTAATGKGFAIGSAALTALALFAAFIQVVQVQIQSQVENRADASLTPNTALYLGHGKFALSLPPEDPEYVELEGNAESRDSRALVSPSRTEAAIIDWANSDPDAVDELVAYSRGSGDGAPAYQWTYDGALGAAREPGVKPARLSIALASGQEVGVEIVRIPKAKISDILAYYDVTLTNPRVLGGVFIGVLLTFLFCAMTMNAVGRAAYAMMNECRRQFGKMREGLRSEGADEATIADALSWPKDRKIKHSDGKEYPDYAECVAISTTGAQKEMVIPSILAIVVPIAVGLVLSVPGVMGMLAGGLTCGFAVGIYMANAGGAWDNAKKLLESYGKITASDMVNNANGAEKVPANIRDAIMARAQEAVAAGNGDEIVYGKGSEDHKATVVGDTVGDPFKDTSGPSLNILIKLISIVSVVFAGLTVAYGPIIGSLLGLD